MMRVKDEKVFQELINDLTEIRKIRLANPNIENKWEIYHKIIVPYYQKVGKEIPRYYEPDYNEGWK
jgi:hypothetical protein